MHFVKRFVAAEKRHIDDETEALRHTTKQRLLLYKQFKRLDKRTILLGVQNFFCLL